MVDEKSTRFVDVSLSVSKVGRIDSKNERFDAVVLIELTWDDAELVEIVRRCNGAASHGADDRFSEIEGLVKAVECYRFDSKLNWTPKLVISNAIGELKEEASYELQVFSEGSETDESSCLDSILNNAVVRVREKRTVKGTFYQKLDLREFPFDLQELNITMSSQRDVQNVMFRESPVKNSTINVNEFVDVQQWKLLSHLRLTSKLERDHFYATDKPFFTVTIFASRRPLYFMFNIYMVLFFLSSLSLYTFSITPALPSFRCIVCCILFMVPVNFRWISTQLLPSVRYLTRMDKFGISCFVLSILVMTWHPIIGSNLITTNLDEKKSTDKIAFYVFASVELAFHFVSIGIFVYFFFKRKSLVKKIERPKVEGKLKKIS